MGKFGNEVLYGLLTLTVCQTSLDGMQLFDYCVSYNGHDSYKDHRQALAISSLSLPHKCKPREGCEKSLYTSEIRDQGPLVIVIL